MDESGSLHYMEFLAATIEARGYIEVRGVWYLVLRVCISHAARSLASLLRMRCSVCSQNTPFVKQFPPAACCSQSCTPSYHHVGARECSCGGSAGSRNGSPPGCFAPSVLCAPIYVFVLRFFCYVSRSVGGFASSRTHCRFVSIAFARNHPVLLCHFRIS